MKPGQYVVRPDGDVWRVEQVARIVYGVPVVGLTLASFRSAEDAAAYARWTQEREGQ